MVRGSPNPRYFGLAARLRKARKQSGMTRMALGQKVGRDPSIASDIETGQRLPTVGTIARLAAGLAVSASWLGFRIGDMHTDDQAVTCDDMGARLQAARVERGLTKAALARLVELSPTALANIENGAQSGIEVIDALAQELGVSPGWLAFNQGLQVLPTRRRGRPPAQAPAPEPAASTR